MNIAIINGPNLNMLGSREENFYGNFTLLDLEIFLKENKRKTSNLFFFQSNQEGSIIDYIHQCKDNSIDSIIANFGGLTHTSVAIRDAILLVQIPIIEVHISNIYQRENFRHHSYISSIAKGSIIGLGKYSYLLALQYFEHNKKDM